MNREYIEQQIKKQYDSVKKGKEHSQIGYCFYQGEMVHMEREEEREIQKKLLFADIKKVKEHFRTGELKVKQLVRYFIHQICKENSCYHGVISVNPYVLMEAEFYDMNPELLHRLPLYGIPILLKDNIAVENMPNTAGAHCLKDATPPRDSIVAKRLKEKGALILGKTNMSEWANFMTSQSANGYSSLGGQTRNALGKFDVGGSSSGSAVSVARGYCMGAIGTETCGSIIYPAMQNGIIGLKPTLGRVEGDLIIPITHFQDTAGPMGTTISDISLLFSAMMEENREEQKTMRRNCTLQIEEIEGRSHEEEVHCVLFFPQNESLQEERDQEQNQILENYVSKWERQGAKVIRKNLIKEEEIFLMKVMKASFQRDLKLYLKETGNDKIQSLEDVIAYNASDLEKYAPYGQDLLLESAEIEMEEEELLSLAEQNRERAKKVLEDAFQQGADGILSLGVELAVFYSAAGYPALNFPIGKKKNGEPVGITLVGKPFQEEHLLEMAKNMMKIGD